MSERYEITFNEGGVDAFETILTGGIAKVVEKTLDTVTGDENHGWYCNVKDTVTKVKVSCWGVTKAEAQEKALSEIKRKIEDFENEQENERRDSENREKENALRKQKQLELDKESSSSYSTSSSDQSGCATVIAWLVGIVVVVVIAIWLAVNVVLPVALLNSALALAILALVFKKQKTLFAILAIVGGVYMLLDITNGWFSLNFVTKVVKNPNWISAFVYINAAAMGFCIWLLIQPIWSNTKITENTSKRKSLLSRGGLVLLITVATLSIPIVYYTIHNPFVATPLNLKLGHKANVVPITSPNVQEQTSTPVLNENKKEQSITGSNALSLENKGAIKSVKIGNQTWMVENLKATKFNDGTDIQLVTDNSKWSATTTPAFCWYNDDEKTYKDTYGALYNWYAVNSGKLCPIGWHVPNNNEWATLTTYLGGEDIAGAKLKETGTTHWQSPLIPGATNGATNISGFTGLPGGNRYFSGAFGNIGGYGYFWSSKEYSATEAWFKYMSIEFSNFGSSTFGKNYGLSVRCIKDN